MSALPLRLILNIVAGNVLIIGVTFLIGLLFNQSSSLINNLVTSISFFSITLFVIWKAITPDKNSKDTELMFLTRTMGLVRIVFGIIWMIILKELLTEITPWHVIEFVVIYVYYMTMEVYYLDRAFRKA